MAAAAEAQEQQQEEEEEEAKTLASLPPRSRRVRRPDPPNKPGFLQQIRGLEDQIDALQDRINAIKLLLDSKLHSRNASSPEASAARSRLVELNDLFRSSLDAKKLHRQELDLVKEKLREDSRSGGGGSNAAGFTTVEQIEEEMRKLEYRQTHTTLQIDEEKRLVQQFAKLKKAREVVAVQGARAEEAMAARTKLMELLREDDVILNRLKAQQEEQRLVLAEIREKEARVALDIPALTVEKQEAYQRIKSLREEIKKARADFGAEEDEFWKKEKEWRAQQAADMKVKNERVRAERMEREKARKQRALENFVEPYTDEIILCDQLISYMEKIFSAEESGHGNKQQQQQQQQQQALPPQRPEAAGLGLGFGEILVSKKDRKDEDLEPWFSGSGAGKKGGGSRRNSAPKISNNSSSSSRSKDKISLSLDALSSFQRIKVSAPSACSEAPKKIEELQRRKASYLEMQSKARESREKGEIEENEKGKGKGKGKGKEKEEALNSGGNAEIGSKKGSMADDKDGYGAPSLSEAMFPPLHSACNGAISAAEIDGDGDEESGDLDLEHHDQNGNPPLENGVIVAMAESSSSSSSSSSSGGGGGGGGGGGDEGEQGKAELEILRGVGDDESELAILPDSLDVAKESIDPDLEYPSQARFVESEAGVIEIPETIEFHGPPPPPPPPAMGCFAKTADPAVEASGTSSADAVVAVEASRTSNPDVVVVVAAEDSGTSDALWTGPTDADDDAFEVVPRSGAH